MAEEKKGNLSRKKNFLPLSRVRLLGKVTIGHVFRVDVGGQLENYWEARITCTSNIYWLFHEFTLRKKISTYSGR